MAQITGTTITDNIVVAGAKVYSQAVMNYTVNSSESSYSFASSNALYMSSQPGWSSGSPAYKINFIIEFLVNNQRSSISYGSLDWNSISSGTTPSSVSYPSLIKNQSITRTHEAQTVVFSYRIQTGSYVNTNTWSTATYTMTVPAKSSYSVTYNANGGTGAPSQQTKWYGEALTLSTVKPTRTGYTFQGWATASTSSTVAYASGASYTGNSALSLFAVWKAANPPTVSSISCGRAVQNGDLDDEGTYAAITATYSVDTAGNANNKVTRIVTTLGSVTDTQTPNLASGGLNIVIGGSFDVSTTYSGTIVFTDSNGRTTTKNIKLGTASYPFDAAFDEINHRYSVGILSVAPSSGLRVGGNTEIVGSLQTDDAILGIKSTTVDSGESNNNVTATTYIPAFVIRDRDDRNVCFIQARADTDGTIAVTLAARNNILAEGASSRSNKDNYIRLTITDAGVTSVAVSDQAGWRTALGLGTAATHATGDYAAATHYHTYLYNPASSSNLHRLYITSSDNIRVDNRADTSSSYALYGYAAMSSQAPSDSAYKTANRVFATPNGSNGFPTIRALVANDIPSLDAGKISTGTFDAARLSSARSHRTSHGNIPVVTNGTAPTAVNTSNWNYDQFSDGTVHAWGTFMLSNFAIGTSLATGWYWNSTMLYLALPIKAAYIQTVNYSQSLGGSKGAGAYIMPGGSATSVWANATFSLPFYVARPTSGASGSWWFHVDCWYMKAS